MGNNKVEEGYEVTNSGKIVATIWQLEGDRRLMHARKLENENWPRRARRIIIMCT